MSTSAASNPFRVGLYADRPAPPCILVIFGAGGDLAQRKLFPSLMHLANEGGLADETVLVAVSRKPVEDDVFRKTMLDSAAKFAPDSVADKSAAERFASRIFTSSDGDSSLQSLTKKLKELEQSHGTGGNLLFYLAVPPTAYESIAQLIGASGLAAPQDHAWTRIIVEKPFGRDLKSATQLNHTLSNVFSEEQIYRIDHYLGKETVQNIIALRFANALFEPLWNQKYVDHVQITASESLGVEDRAAYYEEAGALRDMIQSHMLQVMAMIAMEPPVSLAAESVRDEKSKLLSAIRRYSDDDFEKSVVRAQYASGAVGGKVVPEYLQEKDVNPKSRTETFCALRLWIDNWRWTGVPFYLRTGKRLAKRVTEVAIQFKAVPHMLFTESPLSRIEPNVLAIRIQPNEGISIKFASKLPGYALNLSPVDMEMRYGTSFGGRISDAYERLLHDAMMGDPTLYARRDSVERGWEFVTSILDRWQRDTKTPLPQYASGTWGPSEADVLLAADGRRWRKL